MSINATKKFGYNKHADYQIHYWEARHHGNGRLEGRWFTLDGLTEDEHKEEVQEWLESLPACDGEPCEEVLLADAEGIPAKFLDRLGLLSEFFEYSEAKAATHLNDDAFEAGVELDIPYDKIEEVYYGEYESAEELARDYVDATGMLDGVSESVQRYFDYEDFGRDLAMDFLECDGHYFCANY